MAGETRESLTVRINGERRDVAVACTVADLLASLGRDPRTVAVELNGSIVPRERYPHVSLQEGDRIEIVQFVQGG
jgi:thiamine biosynthesis protein ThiS